MLKQIFTALLAASVALASPTTSQKCPTIQQDANFDDVQGAVVGPLMPPMNYRGLYFQSFIVVTEVETNIAPGPLAHSKPNIGAVTATSQMQSGTAMITTNYAETNTSSFTLENFYFAFTVQLESGVSGLPARANLNIAGYRGNDNQVSAANEVCAHAFEYNPSTMLGVQQMAYTGDIANCTDIQFLVVTFSPVGGLSAAAVQYALVVDDVRFTEKGLGC